jgi:hypothetical protein
MMKNYLASVYIHLGDLDGAIAKIQSLFGGVIPDFLKDIATKEYYINSKLYNDETGHPISVQRFAIIGGSELALACQKFIKKLRKMIYEEEIKEIMKHAHDHKMKGHLNIHLIYLQLLNIIRSKEEDAQDEIAGSANMLKELGFGETDTGNITDAIAAILGIHNPEDLSIINSNLKSFMQDMNYILTTYKGDVQKFVDDLTRDFKLSPGGADALKEIFTICKQCKDPNNPDFSQLSPEDRKKLQDDFAKLNDDPKFPSVVSSFFTQGGLLKIPVTVDFKDTLLKMKDYQPFAADSVQKLAQALLEIKDMGDFFDESIFPGLKEITEKLIGADGYLKTLAGIDTDTLKKAAKGDKEAIKTITEKLRALQPQKPGDDTHALTAINNAVNEISTYFNDHNNAEQATAQFLSSNDEKILSFIKEMQDMPVSFTKAIMQNIQRSGQ